MVGGTNDRLVTQADYLKTFGWLFEQNPEVTLIECEFGHLSIVHPDYEKLKKIKTKEREIKNKL